MKLKKFFAGVVAAAMMLTMGATAAFAADATLPKPTQSGGVSVGNHGEFAITKNYTKNEAEAAFGSDTLTFEQVGAVSITDSSKYADGSVSTAHLNLTFEDSYAIGSTATGDIKITLPTYDSVGRYTYTVQENAGSTAGVGYTAGQFQIVVTVSNADNGGYTCHVALKTKNAAGNYVKADDITNTFTTGKLKVSKSVTGNMGDKQRYFDFKVTLENPDNKTVNNSIQISNLTTDYTVELGDKNQDGTLSFKDGKLIVKFKLKDTEYMNLDWIPVGVKYTVEETPVDNYTTTINGTNETRTKIEGTIAVTDENVENAAAYVNNYTDGSPEMGVILDNAPYIALMAIVVFGGVALMLNKRRRDEE